MPGNCLLVEPVDSSLFRSVAFSYPALRVLFGGESPEYLTQACSTAHAEEVVETLQSCGGQSETVAGKPSVITRLGDFTALLPENTSGAAAKLVESLRAALTINPDANARIKITRAAFPPE